MSISISIHKAASFTNKFGNVEKWSQSCVQLINWNNIPSDTVTEYFRMLTVL